MTTHNETNQNETNQNETNQNETETKTSSFWKNFRRNLQAKEQMNVLKKPDQTGKMRMELKVPDPDTPDWIKTLKLPEYGVRKPSNPIKQRSPKSTSTMISEYYGNPTVDLSNVEKEILIRDGYELPPAASSYYDYIESIKVKAQYVGQTAQGVWDNYYVKYVRNVGSSSGNWVLNKAYSAGKYSVNKIADILYDWWTNKPNEPTSQVNFDDLGFTEEQINVLKKVYQQDRTQLEIEKELVEKWLLDTEKKINQTFNQLSNINQFADPEATWTFIPDNRFDDLQSRLDETQMPGKDACQTDKQIIDLCKTHSSNLVQDLETQRQNHQIEKEKLTQKFAEALHTIESKCASVSVPVSEPDPVPYVPANPDELVRADPVPINPTPVNRTTEQNWYDIFDPNWYQIIKNSAPVSSRPVDSAFPSKPVVVRNFWVEISLIVLKLPFVWPGMLIDWLVLVSGEELNIRNKIQLSLMKTILTFLWICIFIYNAFIWYKRRLEEAELKHKLKMERHVRDAQKEDQIQNQPRWRFNPNGTYPANIRGGALDLNYSLFDLHIDNLIFLIIQTWHINTWVKHNAPETIVKEVVKNPTNPRLRTEAKLPRLRKKLKQVQTGCSSIRLKTKKIGSRIRIVILVTLVALAFLGNPTPPIIRNSNLQQMLTVIEQIAAKNNNYYESESTKIVFGMDPMPTMPISTQVVKPEKGLPNVRLTTLGELDEQGELVSMRSKRSFSKGSLSKRYQLRKEREQRKQTLNNRTQSLSKLENYDNLIEEIIWKIPETGERFSTKSEPELEEIVDIYSSYKMENSKSILNKNKNN